MDWGKGQETGGAQSGKVIDEIGTGLHLANFVERGQFMGSFLTRYLAETHLIASNKPQKDSDLFTFL